MGADFDAASTLHTNFYEEFLSQAGIETRLRDVTCFVECAEVLLNGGPPNGLASGAESPTRDRAPLRP